MSVIEEDDLLKAFEDLGVSLENSAVIDRLTELTVLHRVPAGDLACAWKAFACQNEDIPLSLEILEKFNKEALGKLKSSSGSSNNSVYDVGSQLSYLEDDDLELCNAYSSNHTPAKFCVHAAGYTEPLVACLDVHTRIPSLVRCSGEVSVGSSIQKRHHTSENSAMKKFIGNLKSPRNSVLLSPKVFSPSNASPSEKFNKRTNAGSVVFSFGSVENVAWKGGGVVCTIVPYDPCGALVAPYKYMFQKMTVKASVLNDLIEEIGSTLETFHRIEEFCHVTLPTQEPVTVVGRICCDSDGKLNAKSILLEGSRETSLGKCIPVDVTELTDYSLFPGQIVAMDGINTTGRKFIAQKLYQGVSLELPQSKISIPQGCSLHVVIATGPFTTTESSMYEPLSELLRQCEEERPDVCILLGPFLDDKNEAVLSPDVTESFAEIFSKQKRGISEFSSRINCHFVVVPSYRDVHHDYSYPQPPFPSEEKNKLIHCVSDPCTLTINGVVFGITSSDILFHLTSSAIYSSTGSSDRFTRIIRHLFTQKSYYPLYPPSEDVNIDYDHYNPYARLPVKPHLLILPSDLKYFIKEVDGCCCVNPGRLTKGSSGGTYTRLVIKSPAENNEKSLISNIAAEIVRI